MICLQCTHLDLREHPKHAAVGFGRCKHEKLVGVFVSISKDRQCEQFTQADKEVARKRTEWWEKK